MDAGLGSGCLCLLGDILPGQGPYRTHARPSLGVRFDNSIQIVHTENTKALKDVNARDFTEDRPHMPMHSRMT